MRKFTHNARTFLRCTLYRMRDRIVKILQFIPGLNIQGIRDAADKQIKNSKIQTL